MSELSAREQPYQSSGFKVIEGRPAAPPSFPYVTLQRSEELVEIQYHFDPLRFNCTFEPASLSSRSPEELIEKIERAIAEGLDGNKIQYEKKDTEPIPVYFLDSSWGDVAASLQERYRQP